MKNKPRIFIINKLNSIDIKILEKYIRSLYKKERIMNFYFESDKIKAIISEMLIRTICCKTTGISNKSIIFQRTKYNKPFIKNFNNFEFNVSHSKDYVAVAVDSNIIGIDIESIQELNLEVVKRFCTNNEYNKLKKLRGKSKGEQIISVWSMKESYVKYLGYGLNKDLRSFDVLTKEGIETNVFIYHKRIDDYILSVCSNKEFNLNEIITEITIDELLNEFDEILLKEKE